MSVNICGGCVHVCVRGVRVCVVVVRVGGREMGRGRRSLQVWIASQNSKCDTNGSPERGNATSNLSHPPFTTSHLILLLCMLFFTFLYVFLCSSVPLWNTFLCFHVSAFMVQNCPFHLPRPKRFLIPE